MPESAYHSLHFKITGIAPLLMHNGLLADPSNQHSQQMRSISGKRKKTEADFAELAHLEFLGSLYLLKGEPCIPGDMVLAAFIEGAKKQRNGPAAKAGLLCEGTFPLQYDGPRNPHKLWEDTAFRFTKTVRIGQNRIIRTRPQFPKWAADIEVKFLPSLLNRKQVLEMAEVVGQTIGIGDWRPRFGRFTVAEIKARQMPKAA